VLRHGDNARVGRAHAAGLGQTVAVAEAYRVSEMPEWPVYVAGWQLECCGTPFAVGDEVEWTLMLSTHSSLPADVLTRVTGEVEPVVSDEERSGYIVRSGGLHAWVDDAIGG
jgi:hypothetical protein